MIRRNKDKRRVIIAILLGCLFLTGIGVRYSHLRARERDSEGKSALSTSSLVETGTTGTTAGVDASPSAHMEATHGVPATGHVPPPAYTSIPLPNGMVMHHGEGKYQLAHPNQTCFSQYGQESVIADLVRGRTPLQGRFFVEVGGFDGETFSNSLYFERELGWNGLLVEANPLAYRTLLTKGRRAYSVHACLGSDVELSFQLAGDMTVATKHGSAAHAKKVRRVYGQPALRTRGGHGGGLREGQGGGGRERGEDTRVACAALTDLLSAVPGMVRPARVDLMILDVEGAELDVLQSLRWDLLDIRILMVEVVEHREHISALLRSKGYVLAHSGHIDDFYVKKSKFGR